MSKKKDRKKRVFQLNKSRKSLNTRKRLKEKRNKTAIKSINGMINLPAYIESQSPTQNLTEEQLSHLIKSLSDKNKKNYHEKLSELIEIISPIEPIYLLTQLSMLYLNTPQDEYILDAERILHQYHIEFLQALTLQIPIEKRDYKIPPVITPQEMEKIISLLRDTTESYSLMRLKEASELSDKEKNEYMVIEQMRNHTTAVRNWAYPKQVLNIVYELFEPIEEDFEKEIGLKVRNLIELILNIHEDLNIKLNEYYKKIWPFMSARSATKVVEEYLKAFSEIKSKKEDLIKLSTKLPNLNAFKNMMFAHSQLFIRDMYIFSTEDFLKFYPTEIQNPANLIKVLDGWSYSIGELENYEYDILLSNPIWNKPLIKLEKDIYSWPIPSIFFEFAIKLMEQSIKPYKKIYKKYIKNRGPILEELIENLFNNSFPTANIYKGSVWIEEDSNKEFENDLLIIIDSYAIVVEAKSGAIHDAAKRGAVMTLAREIRELLIEPSIQAKRFHAVLEENLGKILKLKTRKGIVNNIDLSGVQRILTLGVTLELFPFGSNQFELYEAGFIEDLDIISPSMTVADLEAVFDILDTSIEKLHYLNRREQFEKNAMYSGDEHDLLSFYLKTGFNIGDTEFVKNKKLFLSGESEELSPYFLSEYGIDDYIKRVKKTSPRRTKWFQEIINHLEKRKTSGWTIMSQTLLNLSHQDQKDFEKAIIKIKKNVQNSNGNTIKNLDNLVIMKVGPDQRKDLLIGIAYKGLSKVERNNFIDSQVGSILNEFGFNLATVIGFDVEQNHQPYSILGLLKMKE